MQKEDAMKGVWKEGMDRIQEHVEQTREKIREAGDAAKEKGEELWEDAAVYVKKNPGKAVAVVFGVGLFLGLLLNRSRD